ncbi:lipid II:glycine glycyltransferase FemX [Maricaulis maris]|uniref:Acetyltransferase (GNAT) family protein n=1 Tax=Maricaulis maris TaxID=74318 RepID=A0A495D2F8_9PROT|nr:GNAT family N-acetyltransferase [Maricaulis maris]RKQ95956.1 acetyltransferase (GNAT) family protein [Maricaulis maris]
MHIDLSINQPTWDLALMAKPAALQQDWSYGDAVAALGGRVIRAGLVEDGVLVGLAQFTVRRVGGLVGMALCTRGPVWLEAVTPAGKAEAYKALKAGLGLPWPRIVMFTPDEVAAAGVHRMSRVMTGYSTVMLDLTQPAETLLAAADGKWRNRLRSAEKSGAKVVVNGTKLAQYRWLLETEEAQRAERGYRATPAALIPDYIAAKPDRESLIVLRIDEGKQKRAAMLFLIHGCAATYHLGWLDPEFRQSSAHNLLLWQAIERLQQRGVRQLDLGGVNTTSGAGIARFKIGTGGAVTTLAGTYL